MLRQLLEWWFRCDNSCVVIRFPGSPPVPPPDWPGWVIHSLLSWLPRIA
jgi:hypothetical protein